MLRALLLSIINSKKFYLSFKMVENHKFSTKTAPSVLAHYAKYKNSYNNNKVQYLLNNKFDIEDRYEIVDTSTFIIFFK